MDDESPPCNQDGVAAQADIEGLGNNRVRVPQPDQMLMLVDEDGAPITTNKYLCRGGKDAHFIGNFKWIFAVNLEGKKGLIKRR